MRNDYVGLNRSIFRKDMSLSGVIMYRKGLQISIIAYDARQRLACNITVFIMFR